MVHMRSIPDSYIPRPDSKSETVTRLHRTNDHHSVGRTALCLS